MTQSRQLDHDAVIFDLDGTLWDTSVVCAAAWNRVLRRLAIDFREITADDVRGVTGQPHGRAIRSVFDGLPEIKIWSLIDETAMEDNRALQRQGGDLYPGVDRGLHQLSSLYPLYIVSNCQSGYIETFLETSGLAPLFQDFECWGDTGASKSENLLSVIARNGLRAPIFVGDTANDRQAAHDASVSFIQATYGFGEPITDVLQCASFEAVADELLRP